MFAVTREFESNSVPQIVAFLELAKFHQGTLIPQKTTRDPHWRFVSVTVEMPIEYGGSFLAILEAEREAGRAPC